MWLSMKQFHNPSFYGSSESSSFGIWQHYSFWLLLWFCWIIHSLFEIVIILICMQHLTTIYCWHISYFQMLYSNPHWMLIIRTLHLHNLMKPLNDDFNFPCTFIIFNFSIWFWYFLQDTFRALSVSLFFFSCMNCNFMHAHLGGNWIFEQKIICCKTEQKS